MATTTLTYLEEDRCERLNGQLVPRPTSGDIHSDIQENIRKLLSCQTKALGMKTRSEWSVTRPETAGFDDPDYFTPDVLVARVPYARTNAGHLIPPGFLAVEVVLPRQAGLFNKAQTYCAWGVEHVWIIYSDSRECFEYHGGNSFIKTEHMLHAGPLSAQLSEVFAETE
ncbi:MAG: Uma2 family endonuclease [Bryobacteraceae bacterium]